MGTRGGRVRSLTLVMVVVGSTLVGLAGPAAAITCLAGDVVWDGGGASNDWNLGANWAGDIVPGPTDDACIPDAFAGETITNPTADVTIDSIRSAATISVSSIRTWHVNGPSEIANLAQSSGTFAGDGLVTVTGTFSWTGGSHGLNTDTGSTLVTGVSTISDPTPRTLSGRTLTLSGGGTWTGGDVTFSDSPLMVVASVVTLSGDPDWPGGGSVYVAPAGTLVVQGSGDPLDWDPTIDVDGTLQVDSGYIDLDGGGTSTGTVTAAAGTTLDLGGGGELYDLGAATLTGAGTVLVSTGGTTAVGAGFTPTGIVDVDGGTLRLDEDVTIPTLDQAGGFVNGVGTLTVTDSFTMTGGTQGGPTDSGTTIVDAPIDLSGGNKTVWNREVVLNGNGTWSGGNLNFAGATPSVVVNGTLTITDGSPDDVNGGGALTISSTGELVVDDAGGGAIDLVTDIVVDGALTLVGGHLTGTFPQITGSVTIGSGTTLQVRTNGSFAQQGGTVTLDGPAATLDATGRFVMVTGGTFGGTGEVIADELQNDGGTIAPGLSPGTLTVTGRFAQFSGSTHIEIGGPTPGTDFDVLEVNGAVRIDGTVLADLIDGFRPALGDAFAWLVGATPTGSGTAGDADDDGIEWGYRTTGAGAELHVTAVPTADLATTVSATPPWVQLGGTVTLDVEVENLGPDGATAVQATATVPPQFAYESGSACTEAAGTITCSFGTLASGATGQGQVVLTATSGGDADITFTAGADGSTSDPDPGNDSDTAAVTVDQPVDLAVAATATPTTLEVGDLTTAIVEVTNDGPGGALDTRVTVDLGQAFGVAERAPGCSIAGTVLTCAIAGLASGASTQREVVLTARTAGAPSLSFTASDSATVDPDDTNDTATVGFTVTAPDDPATRVAGLDRVATAIESSTTTFPDLGADAVVLARSDLFPDALSGAPLAVARNAPLLLTAPSGLDARVLAEIERVLPSGGTVYLLGGPAALDLRIEADLEDAGYDPVRYGGDNRFETAVDIAEALGKPGAIFLATGGNFADAMAAGPAAVEAGGVVVLTADDQLPAETAAYLNAHPSVPTYAAGGPASRAVPDATPFVGDGRFETALLIAEAFFDAPPTVGVATGLDFPDALSGSAHIGRRRGPVLLVARDTLPDAVRTYLEDRAAAIERVFVYGGPAAVSDPVVSGIRAALS